MTGQQLFNYILTGLLFVLKCAVKMLIYSPFLFTGYLITTHILHKKDHGLLWIGLTVLLAYFIYLFFRLFIHLKNNLKANGNLFWIPIFIIGVTFSCALPVWIVFEPVEKVISKLASHSNVAVIAWIVSLAFGFFVYSRYRSFQKENW
jgi:hypothetical protein